MRYFLAAAFVFLSACGGGGSAPQPAPPPPAPAAPTVSIDVEPKQLVFSWDAVPGASHYRLLENPDGHSGFAQVGSDIPSGTLSESLPIAVHFHDFANALYMLEACNVTGCNGSASVHAMNRQLDAIGYFKASNTGQGDTFGLAISLSGDGRTLAIGAPQEESDASGIDGDQSDNSLQRAGAGYIFRLGGSTWSQQAYIKASNSGQRDWFGTSVSLSADGNTLAVGALGEASDATGIDGDQSDNSAESAGAVYIFRFDGAAWSQQSYVKASNTESNDHFGSTISLSADGNTLAVGASAEDSNATGINGDQSDNSADGSGAVYVYRFDGSGWSQQAYVKASNTEQRDGFGDAVSLSADGNTLAVGAFGEASSATGIDGDQGDNGSFQAGAVYVFRFDGTSWAQQAYIKASNAEQHDTFGGAVSLSADGNSLAVGADGESSSAIGINGDQSDNMSDQSGAVYVFRFDSSEWVQQAYVKASNPERYDSFGFVLSLSGDGSVLTVGTFSEDSNSVGINGDQNNNSAAESGAAYVFHFDGSDWSQRTYVKAPNAAHNDEFGVAVSLSADGNSLAVGAYGEDSSASGVNGDQSDNATLNSGAAYLY